MQLGRHTFHLQLLDALLPHALLDDQWSIGIEVALMKQEAVMDANGATKRVFTESTGYGVIQVCRGNFVATVEPYVSRYAFTIRDRERERPVIHGYGLDRRSAMHAVEDLLETLAA